MNHFFYNLKIKFQQFMTGRYGVDELSRFMTYVSLALIAVSMFRPMRFLSAITLILLIIADMRIFSRRCANRYDENQKFLRLKKRVIGFFRFKQQSFRDRKTHKYYTCSVCGQHLRVPKGRGKIRINCPNCKNSFIKKT